jgi:hypothetical protein
MTINIVEVETCTLLELLKNFKYIGYCDVICLCVAQTNHYNFSWVSVALAHICNPTYLGGKALEDQSSRPAWVNSLQDARAKWTGGIAQMVALLLCKFEALNWNPSPTKKIINILCP